MNQKALLLEQIAEARKSIRRKSLKYKQGKQVAEDVWKENLKPITEPLEKILGKWSEIVGYSDKKDTFRMIPMNMILKKLRK